MDIEAFLSHYGVKGQKWGVRKKRSVTGAARGNKIGTRQYDAKKLSNAELKRVVSRMELEQKYATLNTNRPATTKGSQFVQSFLQQNGGRIAGALVLAGASAGLGAALKGTNSDLASDVVARLRPKK